MPLLDKLREQYGVGPVCSELHIAPSTYYHCQQQRHHPDKRSARAQRDDWLKKEIQRVYDENHQVYGVRKVWRQLLREGIRVARCTVARLRFSTIVSVVTLVWGISPRQPSGKNIIRWLLKKRTNGSVRYCQYTSALQKNPKNVLLAVCWMQGEFDMSAATYAQQPDLFTAMLKQFRTDLSGFNAQCHGGSAAVVPWICGTPPAEAEKAYYASIGNDDLAA